MHNQRHGISYTRQTELISITVTPEYQEHRSLPFDCIHAWSYHIRIENKGRKIVKLINRHWQIVDACGQVQDVFGAGVIGIQPTIAPGEKFEYASEISLATPFGMMMGYYEMATNTGEILNIDIPTFSLDCPHVKESMN